MYQPTDLTLNANPARRYRRADAIAGSCKGASFSRKEIEEGVGSPVLPEDDTETLKFAAFLQALRPALGNEAAERKVCDSYKAAYRAYLLFMSNSPVKWALEAFIVANVPTVTISNVLSLRMEVIATYEAIFFDVRKECENAAFVPLVLVKEAARGEIGKIPIEGLWKLIAKFQGPKMIVDLITTYRVSPEGAEAMLSGARAELLKKMYRDIGKVRITDENAVALLEASGISRKEEAVQQTPLVGMEKKILDAVGMSVRVQKELSAEPAEVTGSK